MKRKQCERCGMRPATIPDRERMGRLINRLCSQCHGERLAADLRHVLRCHKRDQCVTQST